MPLSAIPALPPLVSLNTTAPLESQVSRFIAHVWCRVPTPQFCTGRHEWGPDVSCAGSGLVSRERTSKYEAWSLHAALAHLPLLGERHLYPGR